MVLALKLLHPLPPYNFMGLEDSDYKTAAFVVLPVPFDSTASFGTGQRNGPHALINASRYIEFYDEELGFKPCDAGIFTTEELEPCRGDAKETVRRVKYEVGRIAADNKFPIVFGGDHLVSLGAVQALKPDSILVIDAHPDDYDEFEGSKYDHATWAKRASEVAKTVVVVGCRSIRAPGTKNIFGSNFDGKKVLSLLKGRVYVSVDLDGFDPSIMPAVGTAEPNGLTWKQGLSLLEKVFAKNNVVGFDLVELMPIPGMDAPNSVAARLAYKMVGFAARKKK
ncbi:agmatinase [Candidatus Micrarchaeota archaeon CG_4_10_14_0_8_um_filter_60_7]|nr:MAG: agmatinase [Candidatus Micrarchaeota archaeon CG_4_10_14_0_8_um_filter_60_7]